MPLASRTFTPIILSILTGRAWFNAAVACIPPCKPTPGIKFEMPAALCSIVLKLLKPGSNPMLAPVIEARAASSGSVVVP